MSDVTPATPKNDVPLLPFEIAPGAVQEEEAASLFADEDSDEENTEESDEPEPSDNAEVGDEEGEDDEEDDSEESSDDVDEDADDSDEEEPEPDATLKVKVDGEEIEVTLDELKKGYSRHADYTKKTQALAKERETFAQEQAAIREAREQYAQKLELVDQALAELAGPRTSAAELEALRRTNPGEYAARMEDMRQQQAEREAVQAERQKLLEQQAKEQREEMDRVLAAEQAKLKEAFPEWADEAKAATGKKAILDFAAERYGFSEQDFDGVTDHRIIRLFEDARRYAEIVAKGKKVRDKVKVTPTLKPGTPEAKGKRVVQKRKARSVRDRFEQTGSVRDAARLFEIDGDV